jgi:putative copper export protein
MGFQDELRSIAFTITRFTAFSAHALIFGLVPIVLLVLRPAFDSVPDEEWASGRHRVGRRLEGFVQAALIATGIAAVVGILLQAVLISQLQRIPVGSNAFSTVLSSSFGEWYAARIPIAVALAVLLIGRVRAGALARGDEARPSTGWWVGWGLLGAALLATSTFSGHATTASPRLVAIPNDLIHLLAGATWFTGIIVLAVVLPDAWLGKTARDRARILGPAVYRFSEVALVSITIVGITGVVNSYLEVGAYRDLIDTSYGLTLVVKVGFFVSILALGGFNHFFLRRRMQSFEDSEPRRAAQIFRRTIAAELFIALMIMGATGALTGEARTRNSATRSHHGPAVAPADVTGPKKGSRP